MEAIEANHWYYTTPVPGVTNYGENKGISFASSFNNLAKLDVDRNTALIQLYCNDNQLTDIRIVNNRLLQALKCWNNKISSLNLDRCQQLIRVMIQ